jgi:hypothetical protein
MIKSYHILIAFVITLSVQCAPVRHSDNIVYSDNPILPCDFADPAIIVHQDTFYATTGVEASVWYSADFVKEDFNDKSLKQWQWSVFQNPGRRIKGGKLHLTAIPTPTGAFLGQKSFSLSYDVTTTVQVNKSDAESGIALIGDEKNCGKSRYMAIQ